MNKEKDLPKRKSTRLKGFDYSTKGAYFVTVCVNDRKQILSEVIKTAVGEGLAPPEYSVKLKPCGEAVKEQLQHIENRFPSVSVEDYVIMPDHIHAIIFLHGKAGREAPPPTLNDVICAFKSLTSRGVSKNTVLKKSFSVLMQNTLSVILRIMKHGENIFAKIR